MKPTRLRCPSCGTERLIIDLRRSTIVPGRLIRLRVYCELCGDVVWEER